MQAEFAGHEAELGRLDQPPMRDQHAVERAVEIAIPEIEEVDELREARRDIVILPDIALKQLGVIWQAVEDLRRGQREPLDLPEEVGVGHGPLQSFSNLFRFTKS